MVSTTSSQSRSGESALHCTAPLLDVQSRSIVGLVDQIHLSVYGFGGIVDLVLVLLLFQNVRGFDDDLVVIAGLFRSEKFSTKRSCDICVGTPQHTSAHTQEGHGRFGSILASKSVSQEVDWRSQSIARSWKDLSSFYSLWYHSVSWKNIS